MKKPILAILLILFYQVATSQTHRFFYEVKFLNDTIKKEYLEDIVVLDVNPENIKSYSNNNLVTDSLSKRGGNNNNIVLTKFKNKIKRKIGSDIYQNFEMIYDNYYSIETADKMTWKISPEKMVIGEFNTQKAETDFGGRHWIAWFSTALPFPYGPYKFSGLPGLILKISDTENKYDFNFIKNRNFQDTQDTSMFLETSFGQFKPISVTPKQFKTLKINYYQNPMSAVKARGDEVTYYDDNGVIIKPNFKQMTSNIQEMLRGEDNAIERNQAINYPAK